MSQLMDNRVTWHVTSLLTPDSLGRVGEVFYSVYFRVPLKYVLYMVCVVNISSGNLSFFLYNFKVNTVCPRIPLYVNRLSVF
jgi:hypothetical protein